MGNVSWRFDLDKTVVDRHRQNNPLFSERFGTSARVSAIQTPEAVGDHATGDQLDKLVNHALVFNRRILEIIDLGEGIPPIAVCQGKYPVSNAFCDEHKHLSGRDFEKITCDDCTRIRIEGDDDSIHYSLTGTGYKTLAGALVGALALRDRKGESNDARYTAQAINRILGHEGDDWR